MCCIGHVLPFLFMVVLCEGVFLALSDPVEHPSASGWIPWYPRVENRFIPVSYTHLTLPTSG